MYYKITLAVNPKVNPFILKVKLFISDGKYLHITNTNQLGDLNVDWLIHSRIFIFKVEKMQGPDFCP